MHNKIDPCDTMRVNLIAAAVGLQQCTKTASNIVPIPGGDRVIAIGTPAQVAQLLPEAFTQARAARQAQPAGAMCQPAATIYQPSGNPGELGATATTGASIDTPEFQHLMGRLIDALHDMETSDQFDRARAALVTYIDAIIGDLRAQLAAKGQSGPMYQAQFDGERGSSVWHDVTEAAYHTFMPEHRRTIYAAPASAQPAVKLTRDGSGMCEVSLEIDGVWVPVIRDNGDFISHIVEPLGVRIAQQRARMKERFDNRPRTAATADFDLPAPNDPIGAQPDRGVVQRDWQTVPKEPTQAMCDAARSRAMHWENSGEPWGAMTWFRIYKSMLDAAPSPASQPVAPETAQGDALHWPHDPTETACSSCGLTMGESRLLHDLKRGEMVAVAPSDAKGKADAAIAGELLAALRDFVDNSREHDVGGGDVVIATCESRERAAALLEKYRDKSLGVCGIKPSECPDSSRCGCGQSPATSAADAKDATQMRDALLNIRGYRTDVTADVAVKAMRFYATIALDPAAIADTTQAAPASSEFANGEHTAQATPSDTDRLDFMVSDKCIMDRTETTDGTRYWLSWPYLYEEQADVFATPRAAIDAQMAREAQQAQSSAKGGDAVGGGNV